MIIRFVIFLIAVASIAFRKFIGDSFVLVASGALGLFFGEAIALRVRLHESQIAKEVARRNFHEAMFMLSKIDAENPSVVERIRKFDEHFWN